MSYTYHESLRRLKDEIMKEVIFFNDRWPNQEVDIDIKCNVYRDGRVEILDVVIESKTVV